MTKTALLLASLALPLVANAKSISCVDDTSLGSSAWVKVVLEELPAGGYDQKIEWSNGGTATAQGLDCRLAIVGTTAVLVDGSCYASGLPEVQFAPGKASGTMSILSKGKMILGDQFRCERLKAFIEE